MRRGWGMVRNFRNGESFSPFLFISWDSVRFVQTLPPPQEVLSISWDLQTKSINRHYFYSVFWRNQVSPGILVIFKMVRFSLHFSSSRGIQLDLYRLYPLHENFSPSRGIYRLNLLIDLIFTVYFEEIKFLLGFSSFSKWWEFLPISCHLVGYFCPDLTPSTKTTLHLVGFTD